MDRSTGGSSVNPNDRYTRDKPLASNRNTDNNYNSNYINKDVYNYRSKSYTSSEEKTEPIYGYYDGDHIYGISPVKLAISSNRRNITELLMQSAMVIFFKLLYINNYY